MQMLAKTHVWYSFKVLSACACGFLLQSCSAPQERMDQVAVPEYYRVSNAKPENPQISLSTDYSKAWWQDYNDPVLSEIIDIGLKNNPDIELALAHLREAEAIDSATYSKWLPNADLSVGGGHGTGSDASRGRVGSVMGSADNSKTLSQLNAVGGVEATWQIDLTGQIADRVKAIHANAEALRASRLFLNNRIVGDITNAYLVVRGLQANLAFNSHTRELTDHLYELIESRAQQGLASAYELALIQRDRDRTRADEQLIHVQYSLAMNKLAALTGVYVSQLETQLAAKTKVPVAGGELVTRLPIDLVKNRGDIQFARLNVVAAAAERAANVASLFPTIGLTAAVGEQRQDNGQLPAISQHIWSVGPALFWPVLDFGALDAAIEVSRLKEHEALIKYKQTVQTAVSDVETHAEAYKRALARTQSLESAVSASVDSSRYAEDRYKHGLTDYLHVIDAYRSEDAIAREYTDALVQTSSEWASLQVSLGQGQDSFRVSDHPFTPKPAIIAMFNRLFESTPSKP